MLVFSIFLTPLPTIISNYQEIPININSNRSFVSIIFLFLFFFFNIFKFVKVPKILIKLQYQVNNKIRIFHMICSTLQLFILYIPRTPTSSRVPFRQTRNKKNATSIEILLHRDPINSRSLLRKLHRSIHQKKKKQKSSEKEHDTARGFHQWLSPRR